jgi:bifunctional DNA-binding transcriptional regulator/antitoxin component of YhaV-PrlF toxin-antitoxin module
MNQLETIIRNIISNKVQNGEMFTAYDITLLVRATGEFAKHPQVKSIVHDLMRNDNLGITYTSSLRTFALAAFPAVVYFPLGADVSSYDPNAVKKALAQVPNTTSTLTQPVASVTTTTVVSGSNNTPTTVGAAVSGNFTNKTVKVGSGNRVRVPAESIRKLGLKSGDKAYVSIDGDNITISAAQPVGKTAKAYTVDEYDNLLFRVANPAANTFKVGVQGSKVVLAAN